MSDLLDQFNRKFPNEDACLKELLRIRYGELFQCPSCKEHTKYHKVKKRRCFECEHCGNQIYPTAGTAFAKSRTPLVQWYRVMLSFCAVPKGMSTKQIQRVTGVTYKCAWRMGHEIRKHMAVVDGELPLDAD
jgi:transposase